MKWSNSFLWVYTGLAFALYNSLITQHVGVVEIIIQCSMILFYYLSRICEALESGKKI